VKNISRVVACVLLAGFLLSACAGPVNYLYGSWRSSSQQPVTLEFRQGGQLLISSQGLTSEAVFEITGNNQDTMLLMPDKDAPVDQANKYQFSISSDTLTLIDSSGAPQSFARIK